MSLTKVQKSMICGAAMISLSACATVDKHAMSEFLVRNDEVFVMTASADAIYPIDSPRAEAIRTGWLEEYLSVNGMCLDGYAIDQRTVSIQNHGLFGTIGRLTYEGRCLPSE